MDLAAGPFEDREISDAPSRARLRRWVTETAALTRDAGMQKRTRRVDLLWR
jgi:hypothetical protein